MKFWIFLTCSLIFSHYAQAYHFNDLKRDAEKAGTIEKLLPLLPESLRRSFALQYESHGLMGASFENPRAILFGDDGRLVITFNGEPSQPMFNTLEVMQFNDQTKQFELHEMNFNKSGRVSVEDNPAKCMMCHGSAAGPRPIWGNYRGWTGMFGSKMDDPKEVPQEVGELQKFNALRGQHPRYQHLLYHPSQEQKSLAPFEKKDLRRPGAEASPNARLMDYFYGMNGMRVISYLKASPQYQTMLPLLIYSLRYDNFHGLGILEKDRELGKKFVLKLYSLFGKTPESADQYSVTKKQIFGLWGLKPQDITFEPLNYSDEEFNPYFGVGNINTLPLKEMSNDFIEIYTEKCVKYCESPPTYVVKGAPHFTTFRAKENSYYSKDVSSFLGTPFGQLHGKIVDDLWGPFMSLHIDCSYGGDDSDFEIFLVNKIMNAER